MEELSIELIRSWMQESKKVAKFFSYYKYSFTYKITLKDFAYIFDIGGGDPNDIYRLDLKEDLTLNQARTLKLYYVERNYVHPEIKPMR